MTGRVPVKVHGHLIMVGHLSSVWCPIHHALLEGHDVAQSALLAGWLKRHVKAGLTHEETLEAAKATLRRHVCCLLGDAAIKEVILACPA